ncbi:TonB-dependent receptor [Parahaliea aestuarii]|uniref:TonB-dependent receptor n=1 Tax=Parahaliea aestuarii TaxID=1852021 RepID=A0A5C8ZVE6_9GAMM|nr:TonB-dependent receptor [Parahaliea aestuarii]TXS91550.1 TonB-dependent receptor [Parahaliea aestuarii]
MRMKFLAPAVTTAFALNPVTAAVAQETRNVLIEEVVVTAQKREERLIDVPVAITAVNSQNLIDQNLVSITEFYNRVPGLQFGGAPGGNEISNLSLRGITTGGGTNPTLAVLVNDVQFGSSTENGQAPIPDFDPATLERVEVLRGPQGTLYGASSLGGLIKYVLRKPDTESFSGRVEAGANSVKGGTDGYNVRGSVNIPIVENKLGLNLSGVYREDPRYIDNIGTDPESHNVNKAETTGALASLVYYPTDRLTLNLSALTQEQDTENKASIDIASEGNFHQANGESIDTINAVPGSMVREFDQYIGRVDWDLDWATFTSITAYGESLREESQDVTYVFGPPLFGIAYPGSSDDSRIDILNNVYTDKFSQELRVSGANEGFNWMVGAFYTKEDTLLEQTLMLNDPAAAGAYQVYTSQGPSDYEETAVFADATFNLTDRIDLQVGGRYARNEQENISRTVVDQAAAPIFGLSETSVIDSDEAAATWVLSPSYRFNDDMMAYMRVATGYRPGGPNSNLGNLPSEFDSDSVINYELGFKGQLGADLTFDVAAFYIDWEDIQLQNADAVSSLTFFTNGGQARSQGLEFATEWSPLDGLLISANATYTNAELSEDIPSIEGASNLVGESGDSLPFTPEFAANFSVRQNFSINSRIQGHAGIIYTYVDDRPSELLNSDAARPRFELPSYEQVDLNLGLTIDSVWKGTFYVRNLSDERGVVTAMNRNGTAAPKASFTLPRTIGFNIAREF